MTPVNTQGTMEGGGVRGDKEGDRKGSGLHDHQT